MSPLVFSTRMQFFCSEQSCDTSDTAAWLAQLVERRTAVREVEGSSPKPDQHSGS